MYSDWLLLTDRFVVIGCLLGVNIVHHMIDYRSMIERFTLPATRGFLLPLLSLSSLSLFSRLSFSLLSSLLSPLLSSAKLSYFSLRIPLVFAISKTSIQCLVICTLFIPTHCFVGLQSEFFMPLYEDIALRKKSRLDQQVGSGP